MPAVWDHFPTLLGGLCREVTALFRHTWMNWKRERCARVNINRSINTLNPKSKQAEPAQSCAFQCLLRIWHCYRFEKWTMIAEIRGSGHPWLTLLDWCAHRARHGRKPCPWEFELRLEEPESLLGKTSSHHTTILKGIPDVSLLILYNTHTYAPPHKKWI